MSARAVGFSLAVLLVTGCAYRPEKRTAGWLVVETPDVRVRTNISRERAEELALQMQDIRDALAATTLRCAARGRTERLPVTVLSASQFRDVAPENIAALYRSLAVGWLPDYAGHIVVPDGLAIESRQVFQHELAHHLVASCWPDAPTWLNEGLASFLETAEVGSGKVIFGRAPYAIKDTLEPDVIQLADGRHIQMVPLRMLPSIQTIVGRPPDANWTTHDHGGALGSYATSWALVHLLQLGAPDLHARFVAYLEGLRRPGVDPRRLFASTFEGVPLQERLDAYVRARRRPKVASRTGPGREVEARVRPMGEGEAHLHLAWLWWAVESDAGRQHTRAHLAAAKARRAARAGAHLLAALDRLHADDAAGAAVELADGLRDAPNDAGLLEASIYLLALRGAPTSEVMDLAARLRPVARTGGQFCTLAHVERARGDAVAAARLAARGLGLAPSLELCRRLAAELRDPTK